MAPAGIKFGPFRLDGDRYHLWRRESPIHLRPKTWDLLQHLIERPGVLMTREELIQAIWQQTAVSDDVLTQSVFELRQALGDPAKKPRYIETVHRRGFRFIAPVRRQPAGEDGKPVPFDSPANDLRAPSVTADPPPVDTRAADCLPFVARGAEMRQLHESLEGVRSGERQVVFVTGEAGIGKTALLETFLRSAAATAADVVIGCGHCIEQYGRREAYTPVIEALESLLRSPAKADLLPRFRHLAPTWLAQLPQLRDDPTTRPPERVEPYATPEPMLRELAMALEGLTEQCTLILALEDLHWSDLGTLDLLSLLAQRQGPARLLIIGTYRPSAIAPSEHPIRVVKQTLWSRHRCAELKLDCLTETAVRDYVRARFGIEAPKFARLIYKHTDGNPLFMVATVDDLICRGWTFRNVDEGDELPVPDALQETILTQLRRLERDQQAVLETASIAGSPFAPQAVAAGLGRDPLDIEAVCQVLAESQCFLRVERITEGPDGGRAQRYGFRHAVYHRVIYETVPHAQRQHLHQRIGEALEAAYGDRAADSAAELALHFERSGDRVRAVKFLTECAVKMLRRHAAYAAVEYLREALALLAATPETRDGREQEFDLRLLLDLPLGIVHGYASPAVRENCERARTLCQDLGTPAQRFQVTNVLWISQVMAGDLDAGRESIAELAQIARELPSSEVHLRVESARGQVELWSGNFPAAAQHLDRCADITEKDPPALGPLSSYGAPPLAVAFMHRAITQWFLGDSDRARAFSRKGLGLAEQSDNPLALVEALCSLAYVELLCRNTERALDAADRGVGLGEEKGLVFFLPVLRVFRGAAVAQQGGVADGVLQMQESLKDMRASSAVALCIALPLIADAYGRSGNCDAGLRYIEEAIMLADTTPVRLNAAENWRIKGELLLAKNAGAMSRARACQAAEAQTIEQCFLRALEVARQQHARALELRAAMSLARWWRGTRRAKRAKDLLQPLYATFTEGFDTQDLQDARALLSDL